jgi:DNA-directed RNA polymerase specialized sigma subunit
MDNDETDVFLNNPYILDLLVIRMLKTIKNPVEKFIFCYVFLLGNKQKDAAEILSINESNVSRHIKRIKITLKGFKKGYNL